MRAPASFSPLNQSAHVSLAVPYSILSYIESFTPALSLVKALLTALAFTSGKDDSMQNLGEAESVWKREGVDWEG